MKSPKPCISCGLSVPFDEKDNLETVLVNAILSVRSSVAVASAHAAARLILPRPNKLYQGPKLCLPCVTMICNLQPTPLDSKKPKKNIGPAHAERPAHFWCGTCTTLQYNWPSSKNYRRSKRNASYYECRACNGVRLRNEKLMKDFFKFVNPGAIESAVHLVAYRQELRSCGVQACTEIIRVVDHRTGALYCGEHFKAIDAAILAPAEPRPLGLLDLANTASQIDTNVFECPDIFSPYPLSANPGETYEELDLLFTSWHQFNSL
jgi:hypothetical protein